MVQESRPCPDVLVQIAAVRGALDRVARMVLDEHLTECIARAAEEGNIEVEIKELKAALDRFCLAAYSLRVAQALLIATKPPASCRIYPRSRIDLINISQTTNGNLTRYPLAVVLFLGASALKLDREYQRGVIFRLGRIRDVRGPGILLDFTRVRPKVQLDIRTKTVNIEPQETVTADSVTIKVNAVLYYRILDPSKAINKVENYQMAVYQTALDFTQCCRSKHPR